ADSSPLCSHSSWTAWQSPIGPFVAQAGPMRSLQRFRAWEWEPQTTTFIPFEGGSASRLAQRRGPKPCGRLGASDGLGSDWWTGGPVDQGPHRANVSNGRWFLTSEQLTEHGTCFLERR